MNENINPYNCTSPDHLFMGYVRLREAMYKGFRSGNSYVIMGGRRCGKTSLLIQIEKDLKAYSTAPCHILPRRFSMQEMGSLTLDPLFEKVYNLVSHGLAVPPWQDGQPGREYQVFLRHLDNTEDALVKAYGSDWLVILLLDDLDALADEQPETRFFMNLRHLLTESRFHGHFRLVATGAGSIKRLTATGFAPLSNLRCKYVGILRERRAEELVEAGFKDRYDTETLRFLFELTGRHPFLLQGVLEKMWETEAAWTKSAIRKAARLFLREHGIFRLWANAFGSAEQVVYQSLASAPDGSLRIREIQNTIPPGLRGEIDGALTALGYHGLLEDADPDEPEIAGTLFRDWYMDQLAGEILQVFGALKDTLMRLAVDERTRQAALASMAVAEQELREPESGEQPDRQKIREAFERATDLLQSGLDSPPSLSSYLEKARALGLWLGMESDWPDRLIQGR
ncbi:hypothetical protein DENIS_4345 [Desulfonema ishimotonii]|uniref:ATP-binding protein n=1 Tax=Desulfonema ishimotonii TaxID=45657 RepID=A0A401G2G0_9BACT|nr:hypothetical protein [Desulfonema ishimotonii]GBC63351.1 hypothetical protein DENIS_4345 [Desulfonema ishimotonii]